MHITLGPYFKDKEDKNVFTVGASLDYKISEENKLKLNMIDLYERELTGLASNRKIEQIKLDRETFIKLMSIPSALKTENKIIKEFVEIKKREDYLNLHLDEKNLSKFSSSFEKNTVADKETSKYVDYMKDMFLILNNDKSEYSLFDGVEEISKDKEKELKNSELYKVKH